MRCTFWATPAVPQGLEKPRPTMTIRGVQCGRTAMVELYFPPERDEDGQLLKGVWVPLCEAHAFDLPGRRARPVTQAGE